MASIPSPTSTRIFKQDAIAWCIALLLLGAGGYAWYYWQSHPETRQPAPIQAAATDPRIMILAYDRVVGEPDGKHLTAAQLQSHVEALRAQGFNPVSVQDLHDFYYLSGKLPAKPVLLVFDHGYLNTYEAVHPVLLKTGWRAAMSLATAAQERNDTYYLYWDRLQRMLSGGYWELLSQGHDAREPVAINATGDAAPFVTAAMWDKGMQRVETVTEFSGRIARDLARSADLVRTHLNTPVLGYVFPYGTPARIYHDADLLVAERDARGASFRVAFSDDEFGVNDRFSDPLDLKRLRVSPSWDAGELQRRVTATLEFPQAPPRQAAIHWIAADGDVRVEATQLHLKGTPQARAWLAGSHWEPDWTLTSRIRVRGGDFWLSQSDAGRATEWRFGGNSQGLFLKQLKYGATVATRAAGIVADDAWHELKVIKRGAGLWVEWDGQPVWERPERLVDTVTGPVGWMAWSSDGGSDVSVDHVGIAPHPYTVQALSNFPPTEEVQRIAAQAEATAALTRPQFTLQAHQLVEHAIDRDLFELLRFRYAWQIVPTVAVTSIDNELLNGLDALPERAAREDWGGLHLDLRALSSSEQQGMNAALARLEQRLRGAQRRLLITRGDEPVSPLASYTPVR